MKREENSRSFTFWRPGIRKVMEEAHLDYGKLQEIRLRTDQPLLILYQGEELFLPAGRAKKHMVTKEEIKETLEYSSHYSPLCV